MAARHGVTGDTRHIERVFLKSCHIEAKRTAPAVVLIALDRKGAHR